MDKFYIVGIRYNPQLGSYLSKAIVAKPKINKTCITAKFDDYGSTSSLRFSAIPRDTDGVHNCITRSSCVYGDYEYLGYSDKAKAIAELQKWTGKSRLSSERAKNGIKIFENA